MVEKKTGLWSDGVQRGMRMVNFIEEKLTPLHDKAVLDLGCANGGISIAFAGKSKMVVGIDSFVHKVISAQKRITGVKNNKPYFATMQLPWIGFKDAQFDVIILNGVLEWVPEFSMIDINPEIVQAEVLKETCRLLKPGGILYIAIENRWSPFNVMMDPHTELPLVTALPRRLSNWIRLVLKKKPYRTYLYSWKQYKKLIRESGFHNLKLYLPILDYRFPHSFVEAENKCNLLKAVDKFPLDSKGESDYDYEAAGRHRFAKKMFMKIAITLGLQKVLFPNYVIISYK